MLRLPSNNVGPDNALNWKSSPNKKSNWNSKLDTPQSGAQEIQQWREERKKNYPREKGLKEMVGKEVVECRCSNQGKTQLKDILAKHWVVQLQKYHLIICQTRSSINRQMVEEQIKGCLAKMKDTKTGLSLGCPVAEIPSNYLSDSKQHQQANGKWQMVEEQIKGCLAKMKDTKTDSKQHQQANGRRANKRVLGKNERYQNRQMVEEQIKGSINRQMVEEQIKGCLAKMKDTKTGLSLGCPVAEIPSNYLSDSKQHQQANGRRANKRVLGKNERYQNRQRPLDNGQPNTQDQNDRFSKKQRRTSGCLANFRIENQREPSLLKKLLSSHISRDKKHLMQVFRFMVMNTFFRNLPEKPLKFPVVVVKEAGDEGLKGESSNGGIEKIADITNKNETRVLFGGDSVGCDRNDVECNGGEEEGEITD
ncbi:hypothetical protein OROGR_004461 [Orobanche gracilis]